MTTLVDMPEFHGLPQPFKDSYRKNMPLVRSAYWNKMSKEWNNMTPDQQKKFLAQIDTRTEEMVTQIQMAPTLNGAPFGTPQAPKPMPVPTLNGPPFGTPPVQAPKPMPVPTLNGAPFGTPQAPPPAVPVQALSMEDRLAISDYISRNSARVDRPSDPKYVVRVENVGPGCSLVADKISINGTPSGILNEKQIKVLDPNIITPQEYYTILSKIIDMQNHVINIPMCDKGIRVNTIIPDAIAYIISTRHGSTGKTSGYAMEGSYLGGLASTKKDWTLIMILFVLVVLLWIIAKKM
jgi:hypothetical protein